MEMNRMKLLHGAMHEECARKCLNEEEIDFKPQTYPEN